MSTRNQVYELKKELAFWERVHEYEAPDWREFKLIDQIQQLENCDQFGIPRYNGSIRESDTEDDHIPGPSYKICKYCGRQLLTWGQHNRRWRLFDGKKLHTC